MEITREVVERNILKTQECLEKAYGDKFDKRKFLIKRLVVALRSSIAARNNDDFDTQKWYLLEEKIITDMLNKL